MLVAVVNTCLLVAAAAWLWSLVCSRRTKWVPVVPGLPLLGSAVALGRGGTAFISQCRQQFGDVFCVRVLQQRMVFVFEPSMLERFFKAPESEVSFKPAVKQFTQRVYGLPASEFFERHEPLLATLRQLLVPAKLEGLGQQLLQYAQPQLQDWKRQGKIELWAACQKLVFCSAARVLFGEAFFQRHGQETLQETFLVFEENFEIAASPVPHLLLPAFRRARHELLLMFKASIAAGDFRGTVVEQLLCGSGMPERYWPNLLLAVLWASQANSMPALYWSLAFLLLPEQADARQRIQAEFQATLQQHQGHSQYSVSGAAGQQLKEQGDGAQQADLKQCVVSAAAAAAMLQLAMDKGSFVSRCVAEAVRLRLHSIAVRFVATDQLTLARSSTCNTPGMDGAAQQAEADVPQQLQQVYHVPRGSILCICPIESHHDARLFPEDPWLFNPDRGTVQGLQPGTVVPSQAGLGYGGGFWRCPGRFFAEMELALLVQLVLLQLQLVPDEAQLVFDSSSTHAAGTTKTKCGEGPGICNACMPQAVRNMLVYGLGALGGSQQQREQWRSSGDPQHKLPCCNLLRLVGFKVPEEPWLLQVSALT